MIRKTLFGLFAIAISSPVFAATVVCSGTVDYIAYHSPNKLMIKLNSMNTPVFVCSPDAEWSVAGTTYTTGPETCKLMFSTFLAAKTTQLPINSLYFDGNEVPASCDTWGNWSNANVRHFVY